jgi:transposase
VATARCWRSLLIARATVLRCFYALGSAGGRPPLLPRRSLPAFWSAGSGMTAGSCAAAGGRGSVIAATVIGDVADITRFPTADKFAAYNGTAPIEVSSGNRKKVYRLSMRGNRRLNHMIHMAAVTQIAHKRSDGHAYYQRKLTEGKTPAEARRALKRKISNAIYARLQADARAREAGPGGQPGNGTASSAAGSHPERQLFGQATPGPATTLRQPARPSRKKSPARLRRTA